MIKQKMICVKSEEVMFPISLSLYETVIDESYFIIKSDIVNNGKNYYYIENINKPFDLTLCNIDNYIPTAKWREQQIKSILDD